MLLARYYHLVPRERARGRVISPFTPRKRDFEEKVISPAVRYGEEGGGGAVGVGHPFSLPTFPPSPIPRVITRATLRARYNGS